MQAQPAHVESIHIASAASVPMDSLRTVQAIAGVGLAGDRYAVGIGHYSENRSIRRDLTLIEAEVLADLAGQGIALPRGACRRNLVTRGIRLNELVGRRFSVGSVECLGTRLCEPCEYLAGLVGEPTVGPLVHRGGLRAEILTDEQIAVGDTIAPLDVSA